MKGHSKDGGNDRADELCGGGRRQADHSAASRWMDKEKGKGDIDLSQAMTTVAMRGWQLEPLRET